MPSNSRASPNPGQKSRLEHRIHDQQITCVRQSRTALRNSGAAAKPRPIRRISSHSTRSRKPPCLGDSLEAFFPIAKTTQIRPVIPRVNFAYLETHPLRNARGVTQPRQSQVESHSIGYDAPTKPSGRNPGSRTPPFRR